MSDTPRMDELEYAEQTADCPCEHQMQSYLGLARTLERELVAAVYAAKHLDDSLVKVVAENALLNAELASAPQPDSGSVVVPREPTEAMIVAGYAQVTTAIESNSSDIREVYQAMLAAHEAEGRKP